MVKMKEVLPQLVISVVAHQREATTKMKRWIWRKEVTTVRKEAEMEMRPKRPMVLTGQMVVPSDITMIQKQKSDRHKYNAQRKLSCNRLPASIHVTSDSYHYQLVQSYLICSHTDAPLFAVDVS